MPLVTLAHERGLAFGAEYFPGCGPDLRVDYAHVGIVFLALPFPVLVLAHIIAHVFPVSFGAQGFSILSGTGRSVLAPRPQGFPDNKLWRLRVLFRACTRDIMIQAHPSPTLLFRLAFPPRYCAKATRHKTHASTNEKTDYRNPPWHHSFLLSLLVVHHPYELPIPIENENDLRRFDLDLRTAVENTLDGLVFGRRQPITIFNTARHLSSQNLLEHFQMCHAYPFAKDGCGSGTRTHGAGV